MGLFKSSPKPDTTPKFLRADLAQALIDAPPDELFGLWYVQPMLDYLCNNLPAEEPILCGAVARTNTIKLIHGVAALTPTRVILVIGQTGKGGTLLGEPDVVSMPIATITNLGFWLKGKSAGPGAVAEFSLGHGESVTIEIGKDNDWSFAFLNMVNKAINRGKLAID
jgi:hypothetical protein